MSNLLCVGTAGMSVWFSRDNGESWIRPYIESGVHRWYESNRKWTHLTSMLDDDDIWSMAQAPDHPDTILVGTQPTNIFVSTDAGQAF